MLTGRRLYDHDYPTAVAERTGPTVRVAPPSRFTQDLPPQLDDIALRGLSRHPGERYATARDMAMELEAVMPLATPSKVGEWVQEVAAESLAKRAARIAEIEHERAAGPVREQARDLLDGLQAKRTKEANETTRQVRGNHGSLPPGSLPPPPAPQTLAGPVMGQQGQAVQALPPAVVKTLPVSLTPPPPGAQHPRPGTDPSLIASGQLPAATEAMLGGLSPFDQTMALPGAPRPQGAVTASQGVRVPPVVGEPALQMRGDVPTANLRLAEEVSRSRAGTGRKTGLLLAGLIAVVVALSVIVLVLPAWIKRSYVNAAKERGIALVVEDVEISLSRIRLLRCSATVAEMPGVYLGAKSLDFSVGRSSPRELLARDVELTIDSPYAVARENLSRYLMAHPLKAESSDAALARIRVENGYVVWSRLMGDNTKLELQDVHGEVAREGNRALGDDYTMTADRISMVTPFGPIGPWSGTLVHRPTSQEITIALSAASAETPRLTYSDADPGGVVLDLKVPRSTIESLGFPKAMFGVRATDSLHVEGAMRVVMPDDARIGVDTTLTLYGARANGASLPVDVHVRAKASGDPKRAVPVTLGVLTYGSFRGKLWGNAWFSPDSVRVEGQWQTAPRPCATAAHVDPGANVDSLAADLEALDRAVLTPTRANQTWVGGDFEFDSRQIAKTRLRVRPLNRCGPRNFP